ncbi:two-component system, chemotaxis family, response regulator CheB [Steroidobacter denitrificans]|uniref:Protein-glutamate methylesterase/protein-glutamine glutaminase n=1 Tax=Steroidobacter denitrificans TaxID=465721 RepID=A0A127FDZ5_STEDE|nr:chemotaxis response regulator protein-glutamate methylesterase [Steroidobacter denitrificans]AMN47959.1 two-component system, chemotaxis family, response regulator CheB [Steroidobacter denitrificans]
MNPIRVLLVDDSAVVRQVLTEQLARDPAITVIAAVADPLFAMARMQKEWPDVIILDIEMPRMDGLTFLRKIMDERPTPVVICSTLTEKGATTTLEALAAGAVSIVTKPKLGLKRFMEEASADLATAVKAAAQANLRRLRIGAPPGDAVRRDSTPAMKLSADAVLAPGGSCALQQTTERIVAIGASTGGTQALEHVLTALPSGCPGVAVVQHMPEKFTRAFAERLNRLCRIEVREARHGERLLPGYALIAPGGKHMMLKRSGAYYCVDVIDGPVVNRHRPSVDVLFRSAAKYAGANALGIIMTGMGDDGARGLREMRDAGASTIAQDEATCVVFGMPKEAVRLGGAQRVLPLSGLPRAILEWAAGAK